MKKIVNLVKNGTVYQVGAVTDAEISQIKTDISSVSATTTAHTTAITSIQSSLSNIYTKSETDAKIASAISEVDTEIFVFASVLPTTDINPNKIYVIPASASESGVNNSYIEYVYDETNSKWEEIGRFKADVDLSGYSTTAEMNAAIASAINSSDKNWVGLQSQYDAISPKDATVAYWIYEESV